MKQKSLSRKRRCQWGTCNNDSSDIMKYELTWKMFILSLFQNQKHLLKNAENGLGLVINHTNRLTWRP